MRFLRLALAIATTSIPFAAHADVLYSVQTYTFSGTYPVAFSFTEPTFLTTVFSAADLLITQQPSATCSVSGYTLYTPGASSVGSAVSFTGTGTDCSGGTAGLVGPLDHDGVYSNSAIASKPTIITLTGSAVTPEPSSFTLFATGQLGLAAAVRKRFV